MLGRIAEQEFQIVQGAIAQKWDKDRVIESVDIINQHYPIFDIHLVLYDTVKAVVSYDRGVLGTYIKQDDERIFLGRFTEKTITKGFGAMEPENIAHIMDVLDEVARNLSGSRKSGCP